MIPKDSGKIAPAAPWRPRARTSSAIESASAAATVPTTKTSIEITSSMRLPWMSPSLPSSGVATADVSRKPVNTHVTHVFVVSRSRWIVGSAGTTSVCWRT